MGSWNCPKHNQSCDIHNFNCDTHSFNCQNNYTCLSCITDQSFCSLNKQTAEKLIDNISLSLQEPGQSYIKKTLWEESIELLQQLHNYGAAGSRDFPSTNNIEQLNNELIENDIVFLSLYNDLLKTIQLDAKNSNTENYETAAKDSIITANITETILTYLKDYNIDSSRCDNCNIASNCNHCPTNCNHCDTQCLHCASQCDHCRYQCSYTCDYSPSECCMYGSPYSTPEGGDSSCCEPGRVV